MAGKQRPPKSRKNQRTSRSTKATAGAATTVRADPGESNAPVPGLPVTSRDLAVSRTRSSRAGTAAPVARTPAAAAVLTRKQEYAFIRSDLRRLLLTFGALTAIMLLLLFLIDR